jgi:penicillin-binding protein 1A
MVKDGDEEREWPVNYYAGYKGKMTVQEAIQRSTNTIPAKIVDMITPKRCYDTLKNKLGMYSLVPQDIAPSPWRSAA